LQFYSICSWYNEAMQPNQPNENWQQPTEQPSNAPYPTAPATPVQPAPVVTVSSEPEPAEVSRIAPEPEQPPETLPPEPSMATVDATEQPPQIPEEEPVHWQAQEYIHHEKTALWFVVFAIVVAGLMAIAIFLMNSLSFAILIPVMAAALIVYTHRPPRLLDYTLSRQGLHVNDHLYSFSEFKSFGVIHDGKEYSIMLIPTKRFRPGVSVYFPEEAGEAIVDMLGVRLPMQELHLDLVDRLIRQLRI
jgi:hypothetical protein